MDTITSNNPVTTELPKNALPIKAALKEAWGCVHGFKATFWLAMLFLILIASAFGFAQGLLEPNYYNYSNAQMYTSPVMHHFSGTVILISIISNIVNTLITYAIIYLGIRHVANLPIKTRMMFRVFKSPLIFKLLGLAIIMILIILGFGLLASIPVIVFPQIFANGNLNIETLLVGLFYIVIFVLYFFVLMRLSLSTVAVLDRGYNPFEAIAFSFRSTKGYVWRIFWTVFLSILLLLVSIIPLGIGLIWSLPFSTLVLAVIYKRLVGISMKE